MMYFCRSLTLTSCLGYKEYITGRTYMAKIGDWRENKDEEIPLDGIGGVNILVKADVHRSGTSSPLFSMPRLGELIRISKG